MSTKNMHNIRAMSRVLFSALQQIIAQETASQITLRNHSKEAGEEIVYILCVCVCCVCVCVCVCNSEVKVSALNVGDPGLIPGLGRSPREGNGNPLQYSYLENPMDEGAWWATVHQVAKSRTRLSDFTFTFTFHRLLRVPWTERTMALSCPTL